MIGVRPGLTRGLENSLTEIVPKSLAAMDSKKFHLGLILRISHRCHQILAEPPPSSDGSRCHSIRPLEEAYAHCAERPQAETQQPQVWPSTIMTAREDTVAV